MLATLKIYIMAAITWFAEWEARDTQQKDDDDGTEVTG